jgi:phosphopantothenoylcysteine decarboxylase/phosphopantothenate--cysteine ligase
MPDKKNILLIITGSIACYKSIELIRILIKKSYNVTPVLTKAAQEFITPLLTTSISGNKTYSNLFSIDDEIEMGHLQLSRKNDLIAVAPASADFIAKIANGYADDLASNIILGANKKIILVPAMNEKMWQNEQTQINIGKCLKANIEIIDPEIDKLACGEHGIGKMASPEKISQEIDEFFINQNLFKDKKILITGGSTHENIDPVRFIGNYSSGIQAIEIAKTLENMGAKITFIAGNIQKNIPLNNKNIIKVKSADQMFEAVKNNLKNQDIFISAAAVADFKPKNPASEKIKKDKNNQELTITLIRNPDILNYVGNSQNRPKLVIGFAAESENLQENALSKLKAKNCNLIIANHINNGEIFGSQNSEALIISKDNIRNLGKISKKNLAKILALEISKIL